MAFCRGLAAKGHQVEVLTTYPSYPGGKLYPGYSMRAVEKSEIDGVTVVRLASYISHSRSVLVRALNYLSFGVAALVYGLFRSQRPDVIYAYHPALVAGFVSWIIGLFRCAPFVYDVQDLWPDALTDSGVVRKGLRICLINRVVGFIYGRAALIVTLSHGYAQILAKRGIPSEKMATIYNWTDESRMSSNVDQQVSRLLPENRFNILYAGNFGAAQGLSAVVDAARILYHQRPDIQFCFMGDGIESAALRSAARNLPNVLFLPKVRVEQVGSIALQAQALLIHLRRSLAYESTVPSKTQASLAMGMPILMAVNGEARELVSSSGAGIFAEPEDAESIAAAVIKLANLPSDELAQMGMRGLDFYRNNLSMAHGISETARVLEGLRSKS